MSDPKLCIACAWYRGPGRPNDCVSPSNSKVSLVTGEPYIPFNAHGMRAGDYGCKEAGLWFKPRVAPDLPEAA